MDVLVATNEYHTSSSAVPKHEPIATPELVAPATVPAVCTVHVPEAEFTGAEVALHGLSFDGGVGGGVIQRLKDVVCPEEEVYEYTRM
jgi:hypothetical protein